MTATVEQAGITEPGLYPMDADTYHADPIPGRSLSSTGARRLVQTCPAVFRWEQLHGRPSKPVFEFGKAAHRTVLGKGPDIVVVNAEDWRTKAAREARAEAEAAGHIALLAKDKQIVDDMAAALRSDPRVANLYNPDRGTPEQVLVWQDEQTGIWCRAMLDWLPNQVKGRRLLINDYKSCHSADPERFAKSAADYGYAAQHDWYLTGIKALGLDDDPAMVFIAQEKTPPYVVQPIELDQDAVRIGHILNRRALDLYAKCVESNVWPGYVDGIALTSLPGWYVRQFEDEL